MCENRPVKVWRGDIVTDTFHMSFIKMITFALGGRGEVSGVSSLVPESGGIRRNRNNSRPKVA